MVISLSNDDFLRISRSFIGIRIPFREVQHSHRYSKHNDTADIENQFEIISSNSKFRISVICFHRSYWHNDPADLNVNHFTEIIELLILE